MRSVQVGVLGISLILGACSKKGDEEGESFDAPAVKPPVANNLPSGLAGGAGLNLADDDTAMVMAALKAYVYPTNGFVGPVDRLGKVDDRMAELDERHKGNARKCVGEATKTFAPAGTMGDGSAFALSLSCQEAVSAPSGDVKESQVGFGISSTELNLMERTVSTAGSGILVLVKEPVGGDSVEIWDVRYKAAADSTSGGAESVTWLHVKGYPGGAEITSAASSAMEGQLACGAQMKANNQYVYVYGSIKSDGPCPTAATAYCADSTTLATVEMAKCTDAGLDQFTMTALTPASATATLSDAKALTDTAIAGFTDFNEEE